VRLRVFVCVCFRVDAGVDGRTHVLSLSHTHTRTRMYTHTHTNTGGRAQVESQIRNIKSNA